MLLHDSRAAIARKWPRNADHARLVQSVLGLTLDDMYGCQEASGNVVGLIAGNALSANGTPTYRRVAGSRNGIYYDAVGDGHQANVHALGSASGIYMAVMEPVAMNASGSGIIGRMNGTFAECAFLYATNAVVGFLIRDDAAGSLTVTSNAALTTLGGVWLCQMQIDRAAATARYRFSPRGGTGAVISNSGSIAGFGSLDGANQQFVLGGGAFQSEGAAIQWAAVATGTQCEGASLLANNAARLGFE